MQKRAPNLLYVFADQLARMHCGFAGSSKAATPNMDSLAASGVEVTHAVSNTPVCAPYRASLFTGKHTTTTGMVINELRMNPHHRCIGHVLTEAGYDTAYIGKWHLWANQLGHHHEVRNSFIPPGPYRLGFDGFWAAYNFHHEYFGAYYHRDTPERLYYGEGVYEPDGQTNLAIRFLEQAANSGRPFALFVSWGTPHDPWNDENVPEAWRRLFADVRFPHPPNFVRRNDPRADAWGRIRPDEWDRIEDWRRNYYAMTANLDWNLGRLLAALSRLGLEADTLVVFTSDHGELFGAHGRRAKNIFYEEAIRVPFLARFPGVIPSGSRMHAPLGVPDIMPTLLSLLGLESGIPGEVEGRDLSAALRGQSPDRDRDGDPVLLQGCGPVADFADGYEWRAVRDRRYTYAVCRSDGAEFLFDNEADPWQLHNRIDDRGLCGVRKRLRTWMERKMDELDDTFEACTWYRDHWTRDRIVLRGAKD